MPFKKDRVQTYYWKAQTTTGPKFVNTNITHSLAALRINANTCSTPGQSPTIKCQPKPKQEIQAVESSRGLCWSVRSSLIQRAQPSNIYCLYPAGSLLLTASHLPAIIFCAFGSLGSCSGCWLATLFQVLTRSVTFWLRLAIARNLVMGIPEMLGS